MRLRVAVREVEAWLLADRSRLAGFLSVSAGAIPASPEAEDDPKQTLVNLAARSRRRDIRIDMVPRPGSGKNVGPAYTARLIEFISAGDNPWSPVDAALRADSLRRCMSALEIFAN